MRTGLILLPLLVCAGPVAAQSAPPSRPEVQQVERVLADPATTDRVVDVVQGLSQSLLNLPAGQVQAAIEGRQASPEERRMTVGDIARRNNPNFDRDFQRELANAGPEMRQRMHAMSAALPEMMQSLKQAEKALKRAAANMPDPNYPRR